MHQVKVRRKELLDKLHTNRAKHRELFLEAQEGYREQMIKELDQMLKDAREGKKIRRAVSLPEPQDHTRDYDAVIAMLEMSVDIEIVLDATSFRQYVLDQWAWKSGLSVSNYGYLTKSKPPADDFAEE